MSRDFSEENIRNLQITIHRSHPLPPNSIKNQSSDQYELVQINVQMFPISISRSSNIQGPETRETLQISRDKLENQDPDNCIIHEAHRSIIR